jgi:hypothetical protein
MPISDFLKGVAKKASESIWIDPRVSTIQDTQIGISEQGTKHCRRVDENVARLLQFAHAEKALTQFELYLLSAASAVHDIGKSSHSEVKDCIQFLPFYISHDHGLTSQYLISETSLKEKIFEEPIHSDLVGQIVATHNNGNMYLVDPDTKHFGFPSQSKKYVVRLRLLAAIFRLADMLDCTFERSRSLGISATAANISPTNIGRRHIASWEIHPDYPECIYFSVAPAKQNVLRAVFDEINNLNCQMSDEQINVLRQWPLAKTKNSKYFSPLPYRFLCGKDLALRVDDDVFPIHPELRDIKEFLRFYIDQSRMIFNPVRLRDYTINVTANYPRNEAKIKYKISGENTGIGSLCGLIHPIAGDSRATFDDLSIRTTVRFKQKNRWSKRHRINVRARSNGDELIKELCVPFETSLITGDKFEIDMSYNWPALTSKRQSLWWIDDLYSKEQTKHLAIEVQFRGLKLDDVEGYYVNTKSYRTMRIPGHEIKKEKSKFLWRKESPPVRGLNVFVCRTED